MDIMELRRGLLMQMAGGQKNYNYLYGKTYSPGYFSGSGTISSQSASKEIYFDDYIDLEETSTKLILIIRSNAANFSYWAANAAYGAEKNFIQRDSWPNPTNFGNGIYISLMNITNANYKYIRLSARSFGNADFILLKSEELFDALQNSGTKPIHVEQ